jgi:preprotein translocase subunit SecA
MTGTAIEVAPEMRSVYALDVLPFRRNGHWRRDLGQRVFLDSERRWAAVVERAAAMRADGRAVLIGTRSVAASELASQRLLAAGLPHAVLNARQDAGEAAIIGRPGSRADHRRHQHGRPWHRHRAQHGSAAGRRICT